ncbi:hypothetical protein SAMN05660484_00888 [Eubacterium ruminantium]|uniref:Uncharacterized protein n=1 Tax=Eubacterium ruminantium TaxID=42322 RepID=A0A1T4LPP7_9FIRM|nr:hypothetical protein [Eubacterium ruminantium]SCW40629.1 hypothetical protein SAMN05660484_00888 [Eubacterium ruminantium]SDM38844.1 hypothetical protein SAMN04490370_10312 [Eubacterium ruminantium]SJZ56702.1 hypothetical protein SAMN02745110_00864 [Eubacterium ruminantium]
MNPINGSVSPERRQEIIDEFDAYADKSVAAIESIELDEKTMGDIIKEEIDRINAKRKNEISVT